MNGGDLCALARFGKMSRFTHFTRHKILAARHPQLFCTPGGEGGGGGCMVALTQHPQRVAEAIEVAGGTPLISRLGADGVRIL